MKACPSCGRLYPVDAGFCPVDGAELISATQAPARSHPDDPRVGQLLFERYELRRVVADGGMGRVYEALDLTERRNVAVKVLHPAVARDQVQVERFKREFEVSRELPHAHIVEVLDFRATKDGTYALVMEFLFGEELRANLAREGRMSAARLLRMMSQIAIGLDKAHALSLVHRDLKPDNVFLCQTPDGDIVKLLDFGSVKDRAEGAKKLTVVGTTIGSPYYMSPEQAQGLESLDHRADIWALGAITFEALSGKVPFQGVNGPSILLQILTQEPPPLSKAAEGVEPPLPVTLDVVLERTFKKLPSLRYESVGKFADALGRALGMSGDHLEWAITPERVLSERIEAARAAVDASSSTRKRDATSSFFGELDALGEANSRPNTAPPPAAEPSSPYDSVPAGLPTGGSAAKWWGLAVVAAVLVVGLLWSLL